MNASQPLQGKAYSLAQASQKLGKSESSIKTYKRLVLEAFAKSPEQVVFPNGRLTERGFQQLSKAAHFIQKGDRQGYIKAVFQANPDLEYPLADHSQSPRPTASNTDYTGVQAAGALVPRNSSQLSTQYAEFDREAALAQVEALQQQGREQALNLNDIFINYGRARTEQALHEIDSTINTLRNNALTEAGALFQKKPQPGKPGNPERGSSRDTKTP